MHSFSSSTIVHSAKYPGVSFKVRALNIVQRAKRDASIAAHRMEYSRLTNERFSLFKLAVGPSETAFIRALKAEVAKMALPEDHPVTVGLNAFLSSAEMEAKLAQLPAETVQQISALSDQANLIHNEHIAPVIIGKGLIEVTGLEIDGAAPDTESLIANAPDDLLTEIFDACEKGGELTDEEAKN